MMKRLFSAAVTVAILFTLCPCAFAIDGQAEENRIVFTQVSQLAQGASMQCEVETGDGCIAVGIERVAGFGRAGGETWRVWYKGLNTDVEFYMTVSNNKVTSIYDYSISLFGSSYADPDLSMTSTYGKLTFTRKAALGLTSSTCWLKGTVTGENDEIEVTWQM